MIVIKISQTGVHSEIVEAEQESAYLILLL